VDRRAPTVPTRLRVAEALPTVVRLVWRRAKDDVGVVRYEVFRGSKRIGTTRKTSFRDTKVKAGSRYRYSVRAVDAAGHKGKRTRAIEVRVPRRSTPGPAGSTLPTATGTTGGTPPAAVPPPAPAPVLLTTAMVDRLFWRAGFGPSAAERQTWTGRPVAELVDWFMTARPPVDPSVPPPLTSTNAPIDPLVSREELVMAWLYEMQRAGNPLAERLALMWHDHWAITAADGIPFRFVLTYRDRLRRYGDLATNPDVTFRDLAIEMTTQDGAMSLFLNGTQNTKTRPNENYGREFLELFCLGVVADDGSANYTQTDVMELARAFTGWRVDQQPANATYGTVSFNAASHDNTTKTIFGQAGNWSAIAGTPAGAQSAVDLVLTHPAHATYVVRRLWREFIVSPVPAATLAELVGLYNDNGTKLAPVVRRILSDPLIFESLDEPNMIKSPVVFLVGAQRAMNAPMKWFWQREALQNMQQLLHYPPNVAGWEGGLSWLNTNTAQARFDAIRRLLYLKHRPSPDATSSTGYPGSVALPDPGSGETAQQAVDAAIAACGTPWLSDGARSRLLAFASSHPTTTATNRLQRAYALRALVLGGPDAQVM